MAALKASHIDTTTPDETCREFLEGVLHVNYDFDAEDRSDSENDAAQVDKVCHSKFSGLCATSSLAALCGKLVQLFHRTMVNPPSKHNDNVKVGSLLSFASSAETFLGFLGVYSQKPIQHVFIKAFLCADSEGASDQVTLLEASGHSCTPRPALVTSHELFHQLAPSSQEHVSVEHWSYTLHWRNDKLEIQMGKKLNEVLLDPSAKLNTRKPRLKLPFGLILQKPKKKRKHTQKKPRSGKQERRKRTQHDKHDSDADDQQPQSDVDSASSAESQQDAVIEEEVEDVSLEVNPIVRQEAAETKKLIEEHEIISAAAAGAEDVLPSSSSRVAPEEPLPTPPATLNETKTKAAPPPKIVSKPNTYFSKVCGICDVGLAVSGRSKCYYCSNPIEKQSVRFAWHYNGLKPSVWVHEKCLKLLIERDGFSSECWEFLQDWKRGQTRALPNAVTNAVDTALTWVTK